MAIFPIKDYVYSILNSINLNDIYQLLLHLVYSLSSRYLKKCLISDILGWSQVGM